MTSKFLTILVLFNFLLGIFLGYLLTEFLAPEAATQANPRVYIAPADRISESQIYLTGDKVIIDLKGREASWAQYADSNSMLPVLDNGHNGIEIKPKSTGEIHVGDIITWLDQATGSLVVHRVVEIGNDEAGWFALTAGDNNAKGDSKKVRFEDVKWVLVGIIY